MSLLELVDVHVAYGNVEAVKGINLAVNEGEIVTLLGANLSLIHICNRSLSGAGWRNRRS